MKKFVMTVALAACGAFAMASNAAAELQIHEQQGVRFVTGGMNDQEREEMGKLAGRFPIHLVFVANGVEEPLTGVNVKVLDVSGNVVLESKSEGPLFFVDVVGGRYTVEAAYQGETQSQTKDLTGRRFLRLRYTFKE